jgi:predicted P-loop ATPase
MGWRGSVRKSTSAMFDGVAALAAAAGATLPAPTGMPMLAGQEVLTEIGRPVLTEFLASTQDAPARPASSDYPQLPDALSGHGLFNLLRDAVSRIVAMGESKAKMSRTTHAAAILSLVHQDIYAAVCRRLAAIGNPLPERAIKLAASAYADKVERVFVKQDDWIYDAKGQIEQNNSDNVAVFLGIVSAEVRWNAWLERMEIRGFEGQYPDWAYLDDSVVRKLRTRANRTKTRFVPGENFFWDSLFAIAYANTVDPVCDRLDELAGAWDRQPRLSTWLTHTCGVPCDPYHQAVGRNIIGGMVRRIREAGCKHDTMPIFYGPQGTGKSTLAAIIADMGFSSLVDIELGAGQHFTDSVLLGDAAKELVLSLAGKTVAEISEMGMHGSANASHVKAMVSRAIDAGRTAYARSVTERPRRNIFIGTTNDAFPLADPTGNRRFLPVLIAQELDLKWLHENIGQVIGEAAALHTQGHDFAIPREVWAEAGERQEAARQESDIETMLVDWLTPTEHTSDVSFMTCADMVQLASFAGWRGGSTAALRVAVLHRLGFRNDTTKIGGKATKVWVRGNCRPSDIVRRGVRYLPSVDGSGRPQVTIRSFAAGELAPEVPGIPSRSI